MEWTIGMHTDSWQSTKVAEEMLKAQPRESLAT